MTTTPAAPAHAAYLRHPDVHGDTVTFTAANDVWIAPLAGGRAWRLTDEGAPVGYPRFSPDGAHRSEEHTSELQSRGHLVCRLLLEKKKQKSQKTSARRGRARVRRPPRDTGTHP